MTSMPTLPPCEHNTNIPPLPMPSLVATSRSLAKESSRSICRGGRCENFLAVVAPTNTSELNWWTNGPGAREVKFEHSGTDNVQTGSICTSDDPAKLAQIGLTLKMTRGSGKYAVETYFSRQRVFEPPHGNE